MAGSRLRCAMVVAAGVLALVSGCAGSVKAKRGTSVAGPAPPPVLLSDNTICPLTAMPVDPDAPLVRYRALKIGFCCGDCITPWGLLNDSQKLKLVANVAEVPPPAPPRRPTFPLRRRESR